MLLLLSLLKLSAIISAIKLLHQTSQCHAGLKKLQLISNKQLLIISMHPLLCLLKLSDIISTIELCGAIAMLPWVENWLIDFK